MDSPLPQSLSANQSPSAESVGLFKQKKWYRDWHKRVFVNRDLDLKKIKFIGFDMDYTLAVYKSPQYEAMAFNMLKNKLVAIGYPKEVSSLEYDSARTIRGLWFDTMYGNMLKVDQFGNIAACSHGHRFLKKQEVEQLYPNKFVELEGDRIYVLNTLFALPEAFMLSSLIQVFEDSKETTERPSTGVIWNNCDIKFKTIFQDVRKAMDWLHGSELGAEAPLKKKTVENMHELVLKDERLPRFLRNMQSHGIKTFLLTNSDYDYSNSIMSHIIDEREHNAHWRSFFDYVVVNAYKPTFFREGTLQREVDPTTSGFKLGTYRGTMLPGRVYSGGSCDIFTNKIGARGKDVLYVGDHIYGDILKSKKTQGWRTFLIVPELLQELMVRTQEKTRAIFDELQEHDVMLGELFKHLDADSTEIPDASVIQKRIQKLSRDLDLQYGIWGSVFRSGQTMTFFASQIMRYADLYGPTYLNLLYYPHTYLYKARQMLLAHESTVTGVDQSTAFDSGISSEEGEMSRRKLERHQSLIPQVTEHQLPPSLQDDDEDSGDDHPNVEKKCSSMNNATTA